MTDHEAPPDWQFLDEIFYALGRPDHPLYATFKSREARLAALESALLMGRAPMRAQRVGAF
jgi:hypothetical protein